MGKYLLFTIYTTISTLSIDVNGDNYCKLDDSGNFEICGSSDVISSITQVRDAPYLKLLMNDFSTIAPDAFQNVEILKLHVSYQNSNSCIPKKIELTPESFNGLLGEFIIEMDCVKFPVEPNPFKNLKSLRSLWLRCDEITRFTPEFFADFPKLEELRLIDGNIATISPAILSNVSDKLEELSVIDRITVIEPKSFARLYNLMELTVNGGQLFNLSSDMFDGLRGLTYLDLSDNGIEVFSEDTFSILPQLRILRLQNNRISQIKAGTFFGVKLRDINLANNTLKHISGGVFNRSRNLKKLSLRSNRIEIVHSRMFSGCRKLNSLSLEDNNIYHIDPQSFRRLRLDLLNLENNNITFLDNNTFKGLHVYGLVDLRGNNMTEIMPRAFGDLLAKWVLCCYRNASQVEVESWNRAASVEQFVIDDCTVRV